MSILTKSEIIARYNKGDIIIDPYNAAAIGPASVDITLGQYFCVPDNNVLVIPGVTKNWRICEARKWGDVVLELQQILINDDVLEEIDEDTLVIVIPPGETYLGHTNEFIGSVSNIAMNLYTKSTFARSYISICKCSSFGTPGYTNRWTLEINNSSLTKYVILIVGTAIGHIAFTETKGDITLYAGAYNGTRANWQPEMMLASKK